MAIIKKTVPYEILIRFGFGGDHQACALGEFSGAHYRTADLIIDGETGELVAAPNVGHAQDVPQAQLAALVGEQMAAINAGVDGIKRQLADAQAEVETCRETIAAHERTIANQRGVIEAAQAEAEAAKPTLEIATQ